MPDVSDYAIFPIRSAYASSSRLDGAIICSSGILCEFGLCLFSVRSACIWPVRQCVSVTALTGTFRDEQNVCFASSVFRAFMICECAI